MKKIYLFVLMLIVLVSTVLLGVYFSRRKPEGDEKGNPRGIITINFKSRKVEITRNKKEWVEFISGFDVDAIEIKLKELYL